MSDHTGGSSPRRSFDITLAGIRGACAGVHRAIASVEAALASFGAPVYVRKMIVHNNTVVQDLQRQGAIFVDAVADAPIGCTILISAHGAPPEELDVAKEREMNVIDATCPLVAKVHHEIEGFVRRGLPLIIIGRADHDEVASHQARDPRAIVLDDVAGLANTPSGDRIAYVTQTTLAVDDTREIIEAIHAKYRDVTGPRGSDICYATQNRQASVKDLATRCDLILVVGDQSSSNGQRLTEVGEAAGVRSVLIAGPDEVTESLLTGAVNVGVTGAASTPMAVIDDVVQRLGELGGGSPLTMPAEEEGVAFAMPRIGNPDGASDG